MFVKSISIKAYGLEKTVKITLEDLEMSSKLLFSVDVNLYDSNGVSSDL